MLTIWHYFNIFVQIVLDTTDVKNHPMTTDEIKELVQDIKVLGRRELT